MQLLQLLSSIILSKINVVFKSSSKLSLIELLKVVSGKTYGYWFCVSVTQSGFTTGLEK